MRKSGILMPITSLPGKYGIGTLGEKAYRFVDALALAGQSYWQILPLGPTSYGDSPYQSFSTFAGNPYLIDLDWLIGEGLLTAEECEAEDWGGSEEYVDYEKQYNSREKLLKLAFERFNHQDGAFMEFCGENEHWLEDYVLYMVIKKHFGGGCYIEWDEDIRNRDKKAINRYKKQYEEEMAFYRFVQFQFYRQWMSIKQYANEKGIKLIGDVPIYVAFDSADTWGNPSLFQMDENGYPKAVAGCPPDAFSPTGQLWGNPLYNWEVHRKSHFKWWLSRIEHCFKLCDMIRIDHFRAFDEYYSIPYGDETAEKGHWMPGPGMDLIGAIKERFPDAPIIAEDLGVMTDTVIKLLKDSGFPGMKVIQFAFDSGDDSDYRPHNHVKNAVVYTGTHDNDTTVSWFKQMKDEDKQLALDYMNKEELVGDKEISRAFIKMAMGSVCDLCIIPMQDYLSLGANARFNTPSTLGNNWKWRMRDGAFDEELINEIYNISKLYARL